jgi:hypothetical protein
VIPAVGIVAPLLDLLPRDADVAAVFPAPRLPEAVAIAGFGRITVLLVAAGGIIQLE